MPDFDFIIAGGGVSGLSLAYYLAHSSLSRSRILILEQNAQNLKDHALSFWSDCATPFDPVILRTWDQLEIRGDDFTLPIELGSYRYHTLRRADYTRFILQDLAGCANVTFREVRVDQVEDGAACARVMAGGQTFTGQWVFDSRFQIAAFSPDLRRYLSLCQHFLGWEIETGQDAFDPRTAILFDFRVPQQHELRFFYVLPYSERHALVEYVLLSPDRCEETMQNFVENTLGIWDYHILSKEGGVTPLSDTPFPRQTGRRVMSIGAHGGRVKPSAGYAFMRIQRDSVAIVSSLLKTGRPFAIHADRPFYRFGDAALLQIMAQHGEDVKLIYTALFKNNPSDRVLHFLDETASPGEALALMLSLPLHLLRGALFQTACLNLGITRRPV